MKRLKIIAVTLIFIVGCANSAERKSILDGSTCELPCWFGIIVGETKKEELLKIIKNIPNLDPQSVTIIDEPYNEYSVFDGAIYFTLGQENGYKDESITVEVSIINSTVAEILFRGNIGVNLNQILELLAKPEFVSLTFNHWGTYDVDLINSEFGTRFSFEVEDEYSKIKPSTELGLLEIYQIDIYYDLLNSGILTSGTYNPEKINYFPWVGYGEIKDKYWPPVK